MTRNFVLLATLAVVAGSSVTTPASVEHAELRHVRVEGDLGRQIDRIASSASEPVWISWTAPALDGGHFACCNDRRERGRRGVCRLESRDESWSHTDLEISGGPADLRLLVRLDDGEIDRVRAYTTDCALDAGGLTFYEAEGVGANESVRFLSSLLPVDREPSRRAGDGALLAIALHAADEATRALERFTEPSAHEELREQSAFWLGVSRGRPGFERLRWMLRNDPSTDVREQVVFALTQSKLDEATDLLISTARSDRNREVRGQALFWLGQQAGERATETLRDAVRDDPDAEVREQAVFALSQLPPDEGVPLLIELAKTSRHPEVREQALFWLGQSKDPRALDLFEEILAR